MHGPVPPSAPWLDDVTDDGGDPHVPRCGPWLLGELLGRGGSGVVYDAHHEVDGAPAAVKVLTGMGPVSDTQRQRFDRELAVQRALADEAVVQLLDSGVTPDGRLWVAMERLEGRSLADRLLGEDALDWRQIAQIMRTVAHTLQRMHQRGVVHRDVKPGNILLTADGAPRLADFGLVVLEEATLALTRTGANLGTPRYMAPEQRAGSVDQWPLVDVFALGLVLDELLDRWRPGGWSVSPASHAGAVPLDLKWIAHRATDPVPSLRTASCGEVAADLDRWLAGHPVRRRPEVVLARLHRFVGRHRVAVGVSSLAVMGAAAVLIPTLQRQLDHRDRVRSAEARWTHLLSASDGQPDLPTFHRFVRDPQLAGLPVLADAWLWRARHTHGEAQAQAAGRAVRLSQDPAARTQALGLLADHFVAVRQWDALAVVDPLLPPDDDRRRWLAMSRFEVDEVPELRALRTAMPTPRVGSDQFEVGTLPDVPATTPLPQSGGVLIDQSIWRGGLGLGLRDGVLRRVDDELLDLAGQRDHPTAGLVTAGGRLFYALNDQQSLLKEVVPGDDPAVWPALDLLHSYGRPPVAGDVDDDGLDELLIPVGQPYGHGVAIVELDAAGEATGASVHRFGATGHAGILATDHGPRLVVVAHDAHRSPSLFDHGIGGDGPPRVIVARVTDGEVTPEQVHALPRFVDSADYLLVADLDGDGREELVVTTVTQSDGPGRPGSTDSFVFPHASEGLVEPWFLRETFVVAAAQLDADPELELVARSSQVGWPHGWAVFGLGDRVDAQVSTHASQDDALLAALGLYENAALDAEAHGNFRDAAEHWVSAHDFTAASLAAEASGDLDHAAVLAATDLDFVRAAALGMDDPRLPHGPPSAGLDLTQVRHDMVWRHPHATHQDLRHQSLEVDAISGLGPLLRWPLVAQDADTTIDLTLDLTDVEWGAMLVVQVVDSSGTVLRRAVLAGVGSGGDHRRQVDLGMDVAEWPAPRLDQVDRVRIQLTPFGTGIYRGATRIAHHPALALDLSPGEPVELQLTTVGSAGCRLHASVRELSLWGLSPSDVPVEPSTSSASSLADARVHGAPSADPGHLARAWLIVGRSHPDHPDLPAALASLPATDRLSPELRADLAYRRADLAFRRGDLPATRDALDRVLRHTQTPTHWALRRSAHTLSAQVNRMLGDESAAHDHALAAVAACPDPDLARRWLAAEPELAELLNPR